MDAAALFVKYIETSLPSPQIEWGRREFDQRIYERWAAEELLNYLLNRGEKDPVAVADGYLLSLIAATASCVDNKNLIFSSAIHTAETLLHLIEKEYSV